MGLPNIGPIELIIILAIALLIVGPKRLPEMGNAFGRTNREFRKATTEVTDSTNLAADTKPVPAAAMPVAVATPAEVTPAAVTTPAAVAVPDAAAVPTPAVEAAVSDRDADDDANRPA